MIKIKFLATGNAPSLYEFDDEKIIIDSVEHDLSDFNDGDIFDGLEGDMQAIRTIERIDGELHVTLCQKAGEGHWRGVYDWIDSDDYNPNKLYIRELSEDELEAEKPIDEPEVQSRTMESKGVLKIRKSE